MAQPTLYEIQRDAFFNTGDTKAMPSPLGLAGGPAIRRVR